MRSGAFVLLAAGAIGACGELLSGDDSAPGPVDDGAIPDAASETESCVGVDLRFDPGHCGRCNHSCLGGACDEGRCMPVRLATTTGTVTAFARDATHLYWTTKEGLQHELRRAPLAADGGDGELLHRMTGAPFGEGFDVVQGDVVVAQTPSDGGVHACAKSGCLDSGLRWLAGHHQSPYFVRARGTELFWAEFDVDGGVAGCTYPCGGATTRHVSGERNVRRFELDGPSIFWTTVETPNLLRAKLTSQGAPFTLAEAGSISDLVVAGDRIVFSVSGAGVFVVPRVGGSASTLVGGAEKVTLLTTDGAEIFLAEDTLDGRILRCAASSCVLTEVAAGQASCTAITVDGTGIYWAVAGSAGVPPGIFRVAK